MTLEQTMYWGVGGAGSHGKRQADTHTFTKLTTGFGRAGR